jgi:hypothetical protein
VTLPAIIGLSLTLWAIVQSRRPAMDYRHPAGRTIGPEASATAPVGPSATRMPWPTASGIWGRLAEAADGALRA